ncbi:hypothetical protein GOBAR_DD14339 [Gossypium barbadense]|nr:hypothetical protein GOBAR_DD14339 [Gossypium barbadense]
MNFSKEKGVSPVIDITDRSVSVEDEPSCSEIGNGEKCNGKNGWPWKRMKWKDNVVRLLITVVVGKRGRGRENHSRGRMVGKRERDGRAVIQGGKWHLRYPIFNLVLSFYTNQLSLRLAQAVRPEVKFVTHFSSLPYLVREPLCSLILECA